MPTEDPTPPENQAPNAAPVEREAQAHDPAHAPLEAPSEQRSLEAERAFLVRAAREGLLAPDDALKLIGPLHDASSGEPRDLDALFSELREERPWLFARSNSPGLSQRDPAAINPADALKQRASESGLTRDIQLWREAQRKR